jgi:hypothetical protein
MEGAGAYRVAELTRCGGGSYEFEGLRSSCELPHLANPSASCNPQTNGTSFTLDCGWRSLSESTDWHTL